jgi:hypothetical protein
MSYDRDRYNLEADQTVDDETKRRLRGKLIMLAPITASLRQSHTPLFQKTALMRPLR